MDINININDKVRVTLTEHGDSILKKRNMPSYKFNYDQTKRVLTEQLWEVMQTFGTDLYNGGKQVFVGNIISVNHKHCDGFKEIESKTPKQILAEQILYVIHKFEKETGVEVFDFKLERLNNNEYGDIIDSTDINMISFDLR